MKRTQLYLDDDLWAALHAKASLQGSTISELVRTAVRAQYLGNHQERRAAMLDAVGLWKARTDLDDTDAFIRRLRDDNRQQRLEPE